MTDALASYLPPAPKVREWTDLVDAAELVANEIVVVTGRPLADTCASRAKEVAEVMKDIEDARTAAVAPLLDMQRQINAQCKPLADRLDVVKRRYATLVTAWQKREEDDRKRVAAEEKAKSEAALEEAAGLAESDPIGSEAALQRASDLAAASRARVAAVPNKVGGGYGSITGRKVWKWTVEDFAVLPDLYKVVNVKALNGMAPTKGNAPPDIPGIRWEQELAGTVR